MATKKKQQPSATSAAAQLMEAFARGITTPRERAELPRERRYQAERDLLVAILSRIATDADFRALWTGPAHITRAARPDLITTEMVCIHSPAGEVAWALFPDRAHWFDHLGRSSCKREHSASDRVARLRRLLTMDVAPARSTRKKTKKEK